LKDEKSSSGERSSRDSDVSVPAEDFWHTTVTLALGNVVREPLTYSSTRI